MKIFLFEFFCLLLTFTASGFSGQWSKHQLGRLEYWMYLPPLTNNSFPAAVMLNLHGCAQKSESLMKAGNWESSADEFNTIILIPQVPNKGVVFGCWDYYGKDHTVNNKFHKDLFSLIDMIIQDPHLKIDKNRIFVSGISSGGGEAAILTCLRPDLFSGLGLSSSPALGTDQNSLKKPNLTADEAKNICTSLAGNKKEYLKRLKTVLITSDKDLVVSPEHTQVNTEVFRQLTNNEFERQIDMKTIIGSQNEGSAFVYFNSDNKSLVSLVVNAKIGHHWPAGQGGENLEPFVTGMSINFPHYILTFLNNN